MDIDNLKEFTILYVEDDKVTRRELANYLKLIVKEIYTAENGKVGLELFKKHKPDMVLTDIQMPLMDGIEMSQKIKDLNHNIPIIIISAFNDTDYMTKAIAIHVDHYILKPVNLSDLQMTLEQAAETLKKHSILIKNQQLLNEYKKAVDISSIVSKADKKGIITYANEGFCKISGYTKEELIGHSHNIVRHPDVPSELYKDLWQTIQRKVIWKGKLKNRAKDGSTYIVTATIMPILNENGEIIEYLGLRQNVTKFEELTNSLEKRVEQETQKNREKDQKHIASLNAFLEHSPNPIIVYAKDKVHYANSKFLSLLPKESREIMGDSFVLDTLFDERPGCITSCQEMDHSSSTNKVSISMDIGRNIFYILVDKIPFLDEESLTMFTFNNITMIEYQQMKISYYSNRLEDFIKKTNKEKNSKLRAENQQQATAEEVAIQEPIQEIQEVNKRALDDEEKSVLKRSRANAAFSSAEYSKEIDAYVLEDIQELDDIEKEVSYLLETFQDTKQIEFIHEIAMKFLKYASTISSLLEFEDLSFAIKSLGDLLLNLSSDDLDETKRKKTDLYLSNIALDLTSWRNTIFIDQSANDIHYLDSSLFSTILQFEMIFNDTKEIEDEDDFELF